ncbi:hypothetical protein A3Q56_02714 [Intoshia linei]|uniref:Uncharacterized protein n=1 Tax=Intoshia linei TaxID=1819745 RepID=A0A177B5I9_9BILA|nr:hypothetical protein A3Q56_02714 [Intoshia linei]
MSPHTITGYLPIELHGTAINTKFSVSNVPINKTSRDEEIRRNVKKNHNIMIGNDKTSRKKTHKLLKSGSG